MKAMVFAAGLGTRLRPYTNDRPKALVELAGQTLLAHTLTKLKKSGINEVVVNVHHFADMVIDYLKQQDYFGLTIYISDERELLLDTGGGLLKARQWLGDAPFLIHNVDIITNLNIDALLAAHMRQKPLSTLAVRQRKTSRYLQFSPDNMLAAWYHAGTGERRVSREVEVVNNWAYSGVSVISPQLFEYFPSDREVFSIIDVWLAAAQTGAVYAFPHTTDQWIDVGKPAALAHAEKLLLHKS